MQDNTDLLLLQTAVTAYVTVNGLIEHLIEAKKLTLADEVDVMERSLRLLTTLANVVQHPALAAAHLAMKNQVAAKRKHLIVH